jgi:addiction module HigA family antidote
MKPVHPGEVLREEFMIPLGLSVNKLARELRVPGIKVNLLADERKSLTADMAQRLARYFGTTVEFWTNLQAEFDAKKAA